MIVGNPLRRPKKSKNIVLYQLFKMHFVGTSLAKPVLYAGEKTAIDAIKASA
jgi:hypothetical protein